MAASYDRLYNNSAPFTIYYRSNSRIADSVKIIARTIVTSVAPVRYVSRIVHFILELGLNYNRTGHTERDNEIFYKILALLKNVTK